MGPVPDYSGRDRHVAPGATRGELRLERGLSQEKLGELAGLDRTYISSAEAGRRNVSLKTIHKLADALGVSASHLVVQPSE